MISKKSISIFVTTFLIIGFFFLALPEKGYSGINPAQFGCCEKIGGCIGCGSLECAIRGDVCFDIDGSINVKIGHICFSNGDCSEEPVDPSDRGCCVISEDTCIEGEEFADCDGEDGIAWFFETNCSEVPECPALSVVSAVPTLSELGLLVTVVVVGVAGYLVIRRRKVSA